MTTRRGFLLGMLALGAAPAIVRAENLMRLWVPPQEILTLDMIRRASDRLTTAIRDEPYLIYIDPAREADYTAYCEAWVRDNDIYIRSVRYG